MVFESRTYWLRTLSENQPTYCGNGMMDKPSGKPWPSAVSSSSPRIGARVALQHGDVVKFGASGKFTYRVDAPDAKPAQTAPAPAAVPAAPAAAPPAPASAAPPAQPPAKPQPPAPHAPAAAPKEAPSTPTAPAPPAAADGALELRLDPKGAAPLKTRPAVIALRDGLTLGRLSGVPNHVTLDSPDLPGDAAMSRRHAKVWLDGRQLMLKNTGVNRCRVDGVTLKGKDDASGQSAPLHDGSTVVICSLCSDSEFRCGC